MKSARSLFAAALVSLVVVVGSVVAIYLGLADRSERSENATPVEISEEEPPPAPSEPVTKSPATSPADSPAEEMGPGEVDVVRPLTRIAGRVWLEAEGNPAAGAHVAAIIEGEREHVLAVEAKEDGSYELAGLDPGKYRVWAWREAWTTPSSDGRQAVELKAGDSIDDVDRTLIRGVVVRGQVVEENAKTPIEEAEVRGGFQLATTDERGEFLLEGLNTGHFMVTAKADSHASKWIEADVAVGEEAFLVIELPKGGIIEGAVTTADGEPAAGVKVSTSANSVWINEETDEEGHYELNGVPLNGRDLKISASLQGRFPTSAEVDGFPEGETRVRVDLRLSRGFVLAGHTIDEDGAPVEGAIFYIDRSSWKVLSESDAEGSFHIEGASENMSTLTTRKKGYAPSSIELRSLMPEDREEIEIVLEPGHVLGGTVLDTEGNPLHSAWVYVSYQVPHAGPYPSTRTDAEGRFYFEDLADGIEEIGSTKEGYLDNRGIKVEVDRDDIEVVLEEAGQIQGVVVDKASGEPVSPFTVKLSIDWQGQGERRHRGGMSSSLIRRGLRFGLEDGGFAIRTEVQPGVEYGLIVEADGYVEALVQKVEAWPLSEERDPIQVELEQGGSLKGQVVDSTGNTPLQGVQVTHLSEAPRNTGDLWRTHDQGSGRAVRKANTDGEGQFEIVGLSEKPGVLLLDRVGFARTAFREVGASPDTQVFALDLEAIVEGTVASATGEPRVRIQMRVRRDQEQFPGTQTDAEGRYRLGGLPAAELVIETSSSGRVRMSRTVTLVAGEVTIVDFVEATGSIVGTVRQGEKGVANTQVSVQSSAGSQSAWTMTDSQGAYRIEAVEPGTYRVQLSDSQGKNHRMGPKRTIEVGDGETRCDFDYATNRIAGQLVDRISGGPLRGATVELQRRGKPESFSGAFYSPRHDWQWVTRQVMESHEHEFAFDALDAGEYFLTIAAGQGTNRRILGWHGPVELVEGLSVEHLTIAVGGDAVVTVLVEDEAGPVDKAWGGLRLDGFPVTIGGQGGADGRIVLNDVPAGSYRLEIESPEHRRIEERMEIGAAAMEKTVKLPRTAHLVVELRGASYSAEAHNLVATALSGGDPGWIWRATKGDLPVTLTSYRSQPDQPPRMRFKIHPGTYRIRFDVTKSSRKLGEEPVASRELEVKVAAGEEFRVELP